MKVPKGDKIVVACVAVFTIAVVAYLIWEASRAGFGLP